jgi:hypothetical protein
VENHRLPDTFLIASSDPVPGLTRLATLEAAAHNASRLRTVNTPIFEHGLPYRVVCPSVLSRSAISLNSSTSRVAASQRAQSPLASGIATDEGTADDARGTDERTYAEDFKALAGPVPGTILPSFRAEQTRSRGDVSIENSPLVPICLADRDVLSRGVQSSSANSPRRNVDAES